MRYRTAPEAIENAASDHDFFVEDFNGKNCDEIDHNECSGWDTESRRCSCGNRRVGWETQQDSDGMWYAYAEAY